MSGNEDLAGTLIGGYRIVRRIGQGGMGAVYEAVQESLGRKVALKRLHAHLSDDAGLVARFRREAEAAARLGHPGIVAVTDFGRADDGAAFLVMEHLDGRSLAAVLRADGPLAPARVAFIVWQMLGALGAAHRAGIVHRDLKPDNVMLVEIAGVSDVVKLLDFGIAKLTEVEGDAALTATGAVLGTPAYMAPEQARGAKVDARTDLYAVGTLAYEALSGRLPYTGQSYNALIAAILTETPPPLASLRPELDPALVSIVARAMATDPAARFQTADEMAAAFAPFTEGRAPKVTTSASMRTEGSSAPTPRAYTPEAMAATALGGTASPRSRSPWTALGGGVLAVAIVGAGVFAALSGHTDDARSASPAVLDDAGAPDAAAPDAAAPNAGARLPDAAATAPVVDAPDAAVASDPAHAAPRHARPASFAGCTSRNVYSPTELRAAFDAVAPAVGACGADPDQNLEYTVSVDAEGAVTSVVPHGPTAHPDRAEVCIVRALRRQRYPSPPARGAGDFDVWFRIGR